MESNTLAATVITEGQEFLTEHLSPALETRVTFACFQSCGNSPDFKLDLKMEVRLVEMASADVR